MSEDKIVELIEEIDLCIKLLKDKREDWRAWRMIYDKRKEERDLKRKELRG